MSRTRSGSFATADSRAAQRSNDPPRRKARRRSRSAGYSEAPGRAQPARLRAPARAAARQPPNPSGRGARQLRGRLPAEASSQPCAATTSASIAPAPQREVPSYPRPYTGKVPDPRPLGRWPTAQPRAGSQTPRVRHYSDPNRLQALRRDPSMSPSSRRRGYSTLRAQSRSPWASASAISGRAPAEGIRFRPEGLRTREAPSEAHEPHRRSGAAPRRVVLWAGGGRHPRRGGFAQVSSTALVLGLEIARFPTWGLKRPGRLANSQRPGRRKKDSERSGCVP